MYFFCHLLTNRKVTEETKKLLDLLTTKRQKNPAIFATKFWFSEAQNEINKGLLKGLGNRHYYNVSRWPIVFSNLLPRCFSSLKVINTFGPKSMADAMRAARA